MIASDGIDPVNQRKAMHVVGALPGLHRDPASFRRRGYRSVFTMWCKMILHRTRKTVLGDRAGQQFLIIGRLKPGMTAAAAEPALKDRHKFGKGISSRTKGSNLPDGGVAHFCEHKPT
jgi:hypothetical protein